MTAIPSRRDVARVDSPEIGRRLSDAHRVRPLIPPGDWAATDPFLLLRRTEGRVCRIPCTGGPLRSLIVDQRQDVGHGGLEGAHVEGPQVAVDL